MRTQKETSIIIEKAIKEILSKKVITDRLIVKTCLKHKINEYNVRKILGINK